MKKLTIIITLGVIFLALSPTYHPVSAFANHYASHDGSPSAATCTMVAPCTLQHAVDIANPGDTVYVESGSYTSTATQVLLINKDLTLMGRCSFTGFSADCSAKNPSTILDGELLRRVITILGTAENKIAVSLQYFDVTQGNATGIDTSLEGYGGGLHATLFESLEIKNCKFYQNYGAIKIGVGAVFQGYGGALAIYGGSHVNISDNQFIENYAINDGIGLGGAIFTGSSVSYDLVIKNNLFDSNQCSPLNGTGSKGCAIYIGGQYFDIIGNRFNANNNQGPAYSYDGASIYLDYVSGTDVIENTFTHENGKSVFMADSYDLTPLDKVLRNKLLDNQVLNVIEYTGYFGTRIMNNWIGQKPVIPTRNNARGGGQTGIFMYENENGIGSASIYFNTFALLDNGIITDDIAGGVIQNNIFAHLDGMGILYSNSANIIRNLFYEVYNDTNSGTNPLFTNPSLVDPADGDFHIGINSGAINQGTYTLSFSEINDIDNQFRPFGVSAIPYDLGADEFIIQTFMPLVFK